MTAVATNRLADNGVAAVQPQRPVVHDDSAFANLLDTARFDHLWRVAQMFAASDLVPEAFRGKPNNCFIAVQMAVRCGVDPYMFLQNCYVVHGRPGVESKLAIALLNASGVIKGRVNFELVGEGKKRKCIASAVDASSGQVVNAECDMDIAEKEGWTKKAGSKWLTIPDLMLRYRAAMFLIRLHFPEVLMGMQTKEELDDVEFMGPSPRRAKGKMDLAELMADPDPVQLAAPEPLTVEQPTKPQIKGDLSPDEMNDLRHGCEAAGLPGLALQSTLQTMFKKDTLEQLTTDEGKRLRQYLDTRLE